MPKIISCKHGLPISKCKICFKEHHREYIREYKKRPESYIIGYLIRKYTIDLNNLNAEIKRKWLLPPIPLQGKQVQLQNLIDNLIIIKDHTASLPKSIRAQARRRMINELLSTEGRLVSWRKPLPRGASINQNVNTSMKEE